jgi:hypothetical protein
MPNAKIRMVPRSGDKMAATPQETGGVFRALHPATELFAARKPSFTPAQRRAMGDPMLNHATGHTSACKPPFGAGAVARVVI